MKKINLILFLCAFTMLVEAAPDINENVARVKIAKKYSLLKERADRGEMIRVIAKIKNVGSEEVQNEDTHNDGVLSIKKSSLEFERAEVALENRGISTSRKFPRLGRMVFEVDSAELDQLIDSGFVDEIIEDIPEPPHLVESVSHVRADLVHADGFTGANQAVAILDSGVEFSHPFFSNRLVEEACFSSNTQNSTSLCPNGQETQVGVNAANDCSRTGIAHCDHGTHVAGIAAGSKRDMTGVAPDTNIIAVQVFSAFPASYSGCRGRRCILSYPSDQLAALEWILNDAVTKNIAAINMSIGGGEYTSACNSDVRAEVIQEVRDKGIATVISSGNNGFDNAVGSPGCISSAITVGSTGDTNNTISRFSNSSLIVDILAPGSSITSSVVGGGYHPKSGTSMAAPHITGAFAVLREINPNASVSDIELSLKTHGVEVQDFRNSLTFRRLDLFSSASSLIGRPIASLDENSYSVIVNKETQFTAYSSSDPNNEVLTYTWNFGGGSGNYLSADPTVQYTYSETGAFNLNLSVSNSSKVSDPDATAIVTVYDPAVITAVTSNLFLF